MNKRPKMSDPIKITDETGYIVDEATREAYDRIISQPGFSGERSAEAFLRLVERYAANGIRLIEEVNPTEWKAGDRVAVGRPDHAFDGKVGTVINITKPHGFVRVQLDDDIGYGTVLVHPESLKVLP